MPERVRILSSTTIYDGKVVQLKVDRVVEPGKITATREVVHHPGSVVVLPRFEDDGVLLSPAPGVTMRWTKAAVARILPEPDLDDDSGEGETGTNDDVVDVTDDALDSDGTERST